MITEKEIEDGLDKAYKEAGENAYFANGFKAGINFILEKQKAIPIEPPVKPDACRWTDDRLDELEKLVEVIQTLNTINQGSSFLQKMGGIIYESKLLDNSSIVEHRDSFLRFLNNLAIEDRGKHSV